MLEEVLFKSLLIYDGGYSCYNKEVNERGVFYSDYLILSIKFTCTSPNPVSAFCFSYNFLSYLGSLIFTALNSFIWDCVETLD